MISHEDRHGGTMMTGPSKLTATALLIIGAALAAPALLVAAGTPQTGLIGGGADPTSVTNGKLNQLQARDDLSLGSSRTVVNIKIVCENCHAQYDVFELLNRGGCDCK